VSTLCACGSSVPKCDGGDRYFARWPLLIGRRRQCRDASIVEVRSGPSMGGDTCFHKERELVSFVPVHEVHQQSSSTAMGM
jgi:hypothetical protein